MAPCQREIAANSRARKPITPWEATTSGGLVKPTTSGASRWFESLISHRAEPESESKSSLQRFLSISESHHGQRLNDVHVLGGRDHAWLGQVRVMVRVIERIGVSSGRGSNEGVGFST